MKVFSTKIDKGMEYDLISNRQWQVIARNIEKQPENWSGKSIGSGCLNQGNSGWSTKCSYKGSGLEEGGSEKASHVLSNNEVIYHFSGNLWEWVKDKDHRSMGSKQHQYVSSYYENSVLKNNLRYNPEGVYPSCNNKKDRYCGLGYGWLYYSGVAVVRGGGWDGGSFAGVFAVILEDDSSSSYNSVGFRCVLQPKSTE